MMNEIKTPAAGDIVQALDCISSSKYKRQQQKACETFLTYTSSKNVAPSRRMRGECYWKVSISHSPYAFAKVMLEIFSLCTESWKNCVSEKLTSQKVKMKD